MLVVLLAGMIGLGGAAVFGLGELVFGQDCWSGECPEKGDLL